MDPHTTSKQTRDCKDCHANPKSLGLGYGNIAFDNGGWIFQPATSVNSKAFGSNKRLDAFVNTEGHPLVHTGRKGLRPFNKEELNRIISVGPCLVCHRDMEDPVMKNWQGGKSPLPCKYFRSLTRTP